MGKRHKEILWICVFDENGNMSKEAGSDYDAIIVAVNHEEYVGLDESEFEGMLKDGKVLLVDLKGIYKGKINRLEYWSL